MVYDDLALRSHGHPVLLLVSHDWSGFLMSQPGRLSLWHALIHLVGESLGGNAVWHGLVPMRLLLLLFLGQKVGVVERRLLWRETGMDHHHGGVKVRGAKIYLRFLKEI